MATGMRGLHCRLCHADGLVGIGHCDRRHHVRTRLARARRSDAHGRSSRLPGAHHLARIIAVAARADAPADDDRRVAVLVLVPQIDHQPDGLAIGRGDLIARVAELVPPVGACAPGRAFEDEPHAIGFRDGHVTLVVARQRLAPGLLPQEMERGKMGQLQPLVENQGGLDAAIGQKQPARELWQLLAIFAHGPCSLPMVRSRLLSISRLNLAATWRPRPWQRR